MSSDAPHNDLSFIRNLHAYQEVDQEVRTAVLTTINLHLDYRTPDLAYLSLASEKVDEEEKHSIVEAILTIPWDINSPPSNYVIPRYGPSMMNDVLMKLLKES